MTRRKLLGLLLILGAVGCLGLMCFSKSVIRDGAEGRTFSSLVEVPANRVGVVLGCSSVLPGGQVNLHFGARIRAASDLYRGGKVQYLLVSGDNHRAGYDEPSQMKSALVGMGIPAERIYCDYAGFRTLDSIIRAKEVFGLDRFTVISQQFHNERAIYIGLKRGVDIVGFNAADVGGVNGFRARAREYLACTKALADLYLFGRTPRFLGPSIVIGERPQP